MMIGARNILWLVPLFFFVAWPLWGPAAGKFLAPRGGFGPAVRSITAETKKFVMRDVDFTQQIGGIRDWRIVTKKLSTGRDDSLLEMETVEAFVFQQERQKFHITSRSGRYDTKREILTLRNNVRVRTADGYEIQAPSLQYHDKGRKITTRSKVRIIGKDLEIRGKGLQYDLNTGSYVLNGRVTCITW